MVGRNERVAVATLGCMALAASAQGQDVLHTFNGGGSYFVRAEIEARSVNIHGPYPDLQTAQKLQADQTALLKQTSEALREQLRRATSAGG